METENTNTERIKEEFFSLETLRAKYTLYKSTTNPDQEPLFCGEVQYYDEEGLYQDLPIHKWFKHFILALDREYPTHSNGILHKTDEKGNLEITWGNGKLILKEHNELIYERVDKDVLDTELSNESDVEWKNGDKTPLVPNSNDGLQYPSIEDEL